MRLIYIYVWHTYWPEFDFLSTGETGQNRQQQAVPSDTHTQHTQRSDRGRSHTSGHTVRQSHQRARAEGQKSGKTAKISLPVIGLVKVNRDYDDTTLPFQVYVRNKQGNTRIIMYELSRRTTDCVWSIFREVKIPAMTRRRENVSGETPQNVITLWDNIIFVHRSRKRCFNSLLGFTFFFFFSESRSSSLFLTQNLMGTYF